MSSAGAVLDATFAPKLNTVREGAKVCAKGNPLREAVLERIDNIPVDEAFSRERRTARMSFAFTERERTIFTHAFLDLPPRGHRTATATNNSSSFSRDDGTSATNGSKSGAAADGTEAQLESSSASLLSSNKPNLMTKEEFVECWTTARGFEPAVEVADIVAGLFKDELIDAVDFTRACSLDTNEIDRVPFAVSFTKEERRRYDGVVELLYYVPFIVLLSIILVSIRWLPESFQLHQGLTDNFINRRFTESCSGLDCTEKAQRVLTFRTITEPAYFYEWLKVQVVPTIWAGKSTDRATSLVNERFLGIGALRIQSYRVDPEVRTRQYNQFFNDSLPTAAERTVIDTYFAGKEVLHYPSGPGQASSGTWSTTPFQATNIGVNSWLPNYIAKGFKYSSNGHHCGGTFLGYLENYECDGHIIDLPLNLTKADALAALTQMANFHYIDRATRFVSIRAVFFNKDQQVFTRYVAGFEIATGGQWVPFMRSHVFRFFTLSQQSGAWIFFFVVFLAWLAWNILNFTFDFAEVVRRSAASIGRPVHTAFDYGCLGFLRFMYMVLPMSIFKCYMNDAWLLLDSANYTFFVVVWFWRASIWTTYQTFDIWNNVGYPNDIDDYATTTSRIDYLESVVIALCFIRLLKNLRVFPVLRLIYQSMAAAAVDLYGMAFTAAVLFVAFALSGFVAYGSLVPEFSTVERAITTVLRFVIGDYDYGAWESAQRVMSPFYFSLLQVLLVIIVLEFITAIIADTFGDISKEQYKAEYIRNVIQADLRSVLTSDTIDSPMRSPIAMELIGALTSFASYFKYFWQLFSWYVLRRRDDAAMSPYNYPPVDSALWLLDTCDRKPQKLFAALEMLVQRSYFERDEVAAESIFLLYEMLFELESREDIRGRVSRQVCFTLAASHCNTENLTMHLDATPRSLVTTLISRLGMNNYPFLVVVGIHLPHAVSHLPRVSRFVSLFESHATWSTAVRNEPVRQYEDKKALEKVERAATVVKQLASIYDEDADPAEAMLLYGGGAGSGSDGEKKKTQQEEQQQEEQKQKQENNNDNNKVGDDSNNNTQQQQQQQRAADEAEEDAAALHIQETEAGIMDMLRIKAAFSGIGRKAVDDLFDGWSNIQDRDIKVARIAAYRQHWQTLRESWVEEGVAVSVDLEDESDLIFGPHGGSHHQQQQQHQQADNKNDGHDDDEEEMDDLTSFGAQAGRSQFDVVEFFDGIDSNNTLKRLRDNCSHIVMTQTWTERKRKQFVKLLAKLEEVVAAAKLEEQKEEQQQKSPAPAPAVAAAAANSENDENKKNDEEKGGDGGDGHGDGDGDGDGDAAAAVEIAAVPALITDKDGSRILSLEAFGKIWKKIVRADLSDELTEHLTELSTMLYGEDAPVQVNADVFQQYCVASADAHSRTSIQSHFFDVQHQKMFNTVELILYVPFVVFFTLLLVIQQNNLGTYASVSVKHYTSRDFKSPDMRPMERISNQDQWRNWVSQNVFDNFLGTSAGAPYLGFPGHSFLIGGVRIRQFRTKAVDSCGYPNSIGPFPDDMATQQFADRQAIHFPQWCVPRWQIGFEETEKILSDTSGLSAEARTAFEYTDCSSVARQEGETGYFKNCAGYTLFVPATKSRAQAATLLDEVMPLWIDVSTRALVVDFFTYNFNDNIIVRNLVLAETSAGGGWDFNIKQDPFRLFTFAPINDASLSYVIVMCFFLFFYAAAFLTFVAAALSSVALIRRRRSCSWLSAMLTVASDLWWLVEFATYVLLAGSWLTRFFFMSAGADSVKMYAPVYPTNLIAFAEAAFAISIMESVNTFCIYVRFFFFVRLHARLNVLPKTLEKAGQYMFSILVISVIILTAFALSGHVVYGASVWSMSSVGKAYRTLALTIFENGDLEAWQQDKPVWTVIYFTLFTLVCVQILFNMITSVLARAYSDAKDERFNPTELRRVSSVDSTIPGTKVLFPAIIYQELRYRFFYFVRKYEAWRGHKRSLRNRHSDVLGNPYTFYRFMDEATTLLEQGSPRQSAVSAGNLLVTMVLLRRSNVESAAATERWKKAVGASPARLQVYGIERPTLLHFVRSHLPQGSFDIVYYWCMKMPMLFLGVSPADAAADVLETQAIWALAAQKYLELDDPSASAAKTTADRDEKLGELVGSISRNTRVILQQFR